AAAIIGKRTALLHHLSRFRPGISRFISGLEVNTRLWKAVTLDVSLWGAGRKSTDFSINTRSICTKEKRTSNSNEMWEHCNHLCYFNVHTLSSCFTCLLYSFLWRQIH
uniref:Uncharacterized protein n=1 Tax=Neolamprologus brichardi TaxID=32507 RepID=A0A3Q4HDQ7_NEOBR